MNGKFATLWNKQLWSMSEFNACFAVPAHWEPMCQCKGQINLPKKESNCWYFLWDSWPWCGFLKTQGEWPFAPGEFPGLIRTLSGELTSCGISAKGRLLLSSIRTLFRSYSSSFGNNLQGWCPPHSPKGNSRKEQSVAFRPMALWGEWV